MKQIMSSLFLLLCSFYVTAQHEKTIKPSGNIITKDVTISSFNSIKAEGLYELILTQGDKETVKIEADDNLQDIFKVSNDGDLLIIEMPELKNNHINFSDEKEDHKLKVYVSFKQLTKLYAGIIGTIHCTTPLKTDAFEIDSKNVGNIDMKLNTNKLIVKSAGVGNITLAGTATDAKITNGGVGSFDGSDLLVQTMNIDNSGVGNANVNVQKDLKVKQSFLGKVSNQGAAKGHEMDNVEM